MKEKNPRRAILPVLKGIGSNIKTMTAEWGGTITTQIFDTENGRWRKRTPAELPENDVEQWDRLIQFMSAIRDQADSVIAHAEEQRDRLKAETRAKYAAEADRGSL